MERLYSVIEMGTGMGIAFANLTLLSYQGGQERGYPHSNALYSTLPKLLFRPTTLTPTFLEIGLWGASRIRILDQP